MTLVVEINKNFNLKKIFKTVWDEFVYGGHFLSIGDSVALYAMAVILNIPITWDFLVVIYLCVFAANLFNRSDESIHDALTNPVRVRVMHKYVQNFKLIVFFCLIISVGLIIYYSSYKALVLAVFIFLISILYTTLFKKMTKYIIGFKSIIAAFFYALMVVFLAVYYSAPINMALALVFIFYYLRIFISNAACDVKDVDGDKKRELKTIAISFGEKGAMRFLNTLNILSGLFILWGVLINVLPIFSLFLLLTIPYAFYYFYLESKVASKETFTNAIVDSEFILWAPFIIIGKLFI